MHLQCACALSVNKSSVSNCFHPLAVASNCGEGVSCQNNRGLCFRFSTPHPQRLGNKIKTFCAWERGAERRQTKPFSDFFFSTDACVASSAVCDSCSAKENRAIVASVIQGLTSLFNCACYECKLFYTSIGKKKARLNRALGQGGTDGTLAITEAHWQKKTTTTKKSLWKLYHMLKNEC